MAKSEGASRIKFLGMVIIVVGVILGSIAGSILPGGILVGGMVALYLAGFGGLVWAIGWIVQGFFLDESRRG